jgi:cellulose biosynthesis protein BcsQ
MSSIITFYSYKGGVGRSMALANIAYELSKRNSKVLIVDWDLEAPGIERYFSGFKIENTSEGLLQLLLSYKNDAKPDYRNFLWQIETGTSFPISLLHSGRDKDPASYSALLQNFDWSDFFTKENGGNHIENLRKQLQNDFDFVLIDSRTGLSDSSGICTIMMPDILIPMFTANYQSLFGIRDIVKYIQNARQKLEVDRMALTVLPIPSRFGTRVEFKESQEWLERISDILKDCYSDWLPKWIEPKYILEQIKIPQIDYFSYGEKLAVVEQGTNDPEGMGFIFSKIATLLLSDFSEIENFVGVDYYQKKKREFEESSPSNKKQDETEYLYDVYLSYPREVYQWVRELLIPALTEYLNDELGYNPQIYFDINEFNIGESISISIETAILKSKTFVFVITDSGLDSSFLNIELSSIFKREKDSNKNFLFPVLYSQSQMQKNDSIPPELRDRQYINFSNFKYEDTVRSTKLRAQFGQEVEKLSNAIAKSLLQKAQQKKTKKTVQRKTNQDEGIEELLLLAKEYEEVRKKMPRGNPRTRVMEAIVSKMKSVINDPLSNLETWTTSKSAGERLLAIAKLQKFPNTEYLNWLAEHVGDSEKPFIGYHSSVALYISSRTFGKENKTVVENILKKAQANIDRYEFKDPNQVKVLKSAINELK